MRVHSAPTGTKLASLKVLYLLAVILKHVAPGLVIDLAEPLVCRLPTWALGYCLLGLAAAVARISTDLLLVLLLGARAEVYLFPAAMLVPNLLAGFLSGFVTMFVLRAFARSAESKPTDGDDAQVEIEPDDAKPVAHPASGPRHRPRRAGCSPVGFPYANHKII